VRRETSDQTDQESRSAGPGAAASVTAMDITIHASFLPHTDPDASLAFYRDTLGFEVRNNVGYQGMRWITVGPADQPDTSIVLHPPAVPGITEDERRTILELMAKGSYFGVNLATADIDDTFAKLEASGAEVVQEPTDQPYGVRDCAFRDPAGNMIRIQEVERVGLIQHEEVVRNG
jgi:catechol 2,3-dioxygenase-like lactoylglutathione lyase family enzyme